MQSCEVQIAARPSDESFRLLLLDPDAKIHTFVLLRSSLPGLGSLDGFFRLLGSFLSSLGLGSLALKLGS